MTPSSLLPVSSCPSEVLVCSVNVSRIQRTAVSQQPADSEGSNSSIKGYDGEIAFTTDGTMQLHLVSGQDALMKILLYYVDQKRLPVSHTYPRLYLIGESASRTLQAERDLDVHFHNGPHCINPIEKGHIAFRTDNLDAFKRHLQVRAFCPSVCPLRCVYN